MVLSIDFPEFAVGEPWPVPISEVAGGEGEKNLF